ncbi:unnamed protein product [Mesocestoides corti]|uniref:Cwf15/Cwc15 cell cycle control protein n=1 Tax=Mesocestoides corti TaxID=53468 RepID=A0A3P6ICH1_MESCO|nr:unnamed protein product [Mesocestoides corti]
MKYRQEGQGRPEELQGKDFKRDLEEKERLAALEKAKKVGSSHPTLPYAGEKRPALSDADRSSSSTKRSKQSSGPASNVASVPTANLDADDPWEEDYTEEEPKVLKGDASSESEENEDSDDDEDEEALLAELAKIKRERAEEAIQAEAEKKAAEETIRMENILKGNPLLINNNTSEFKIKRRWDDDVVFKNCARGEVDHSKRGFINDTLRSEFHKKFMRKYIQ